MTNENGQNTMGPESGSRSSVWEEAGVVKGRATSADTRTVADADHRSALGFGLLGAVLAILLACALWVAFGMYAHAAHEQGAITLRESILQAADQCYAIEGAYPMSLKYLESRYGLSVNRDGYNVLYEVFASNIAPTVVVSAL